MGWIKRRINKEKSKYEGKLDWSEVAERKIVAQLKKMIEECGQTTGNSIRENVKTHGREYYIEVESLKRKLFEVSNK